MPGNGMDTPSPWKQGPDWEAGYITAMEKCIVVTERWEDKKREKATDTGQQLTGREQ